MNEHHITIKQDGHEDGIHPQYRAVCRCGWKSRRGRYSDADMSGHYHRGEAIFAEEDAS